VEHGVQVWENIGGKRATQLLRLTDIPLTPGPLIVVLKVASSLTSNHSAFWPPALADSIETIAASYVQGAGGSKVRLFNLAPGVQSAGLRCSGNGSAEIAKGVAFSLGSNWMPVASGAAAVFGLVDDTTNTALTTLKLTPSIGLGNTIVLLGLPAEGGEQFAITAVPLVDAPEGGTCHP
jgi:hypothetical protein